MQLFFFFLVSLGFGVVENMRNLILILKDTILVKFVPVCGIHFIEKCPRLQDSSFFVKDVIIWGIRFY